MRSVSVGLIALCACSAEILAVDLPEPPGMHTLLVGVEQADLRMYAVDLDLPIHDRSLPSGEGAARLYAFYYQKTLTELGYDGGELRPVLGGVPLEDFDAAFLRDVSDGAAGDWQAASKVAAEIPFRIALPRSPTGHCPRFEISVTTLAITERFYAAVALDSEVLAFGRRGTVLRVRDGRVEELGTSTVAVDVRSAARAPGGDVWLGSGVRVLRGHPERGYEVMYRTAADRMQWMDGPGTDREELFVLTSDGTWIHYLHDVWRTLASYEAVPNEERFGDVAWLGDGRAAMFPAGSEEFVSYDGGRLESTFSEHTALGKLSALSRTGDDRVAVMTTHGVVLEAIGPSLVRSTSHDFASEVYSMAPVLDGFFYVRRGLLPSYGELGETDCVGEGPGLLRHVATKVVPIGDEVVVFGSDSGVHDEGPGPTVVMFVSLVQE